MNEWMNEWMNESAINYINKVKIRKYLISLFV